MHQPERQRHEASRTLSRRIALVAVTMAWLAIGTVCGSSVAAEAAEPSMHVSGWDVLVQERPELVEDGSVSAIERRVLQLLTPVQAEELSQGIEPSQIELPDGGTLAELI
ncbi:MAG: hypothetical protein GY842_17315, partial [bacterium]|nr:hypothetical protein [bacterium]